MTTLSDRVLSATELRALQTRSDARGTARLAIHLGLLGGTGWLVAIASGWTLLPAVIALGLVQVALFAPAHETMHQTAFASRRGNTIIGWLVSCPSLLNAQFYTSFHLAHHRHTQIAGQDPELDAPPPYDLRGYATRIIGVPYWSLRLRVAADCWRGDLTRYPYVSAAAAPRVIRSVRAMTLLLGGGAIGSALLFGWATPLLYWIGPQLLGQPVPARLFAGRAHRLHAGPQRPDQHAHHADHRRGADGSCGTCPTTPSTTCFRRSRSIGSRMPTPPSATG